MNDSRQAARDNVERRRVESSQGKKAGKGSAKNAPEQLVHGDEKVQQENTDRETDDLYDTEGDNEITEWRRHSDLDAPPARAGYVNRFIRIRLGAVRDTSNLRNKLREGWRPVKASSVTDRSLPTINIDQFGDVIGVEDLILCEMREDLHLQRKEYYGAKKQRQNQAIERQLRNVSRTDAEGFGPIQQTRRTQVSATPPRQVEVADDD